MYGALSQCTVRTYIMNQSQSKFATYVVISLATLILILSSMKNSKNKNVVCETTGTTIPAGLVEYDSSSGDITFDDYYCSSWHIE